MIKGGVWLVIVAVAATLVVLALASKKETISTQPDQISAAETAQAEEKIKEVRSGDGKAKLVGIVRGSTGGGISYTIKVISGGSERELFSRVVESGSAIDIPFNSWSPDNKQFFLEENDGQTVRYLVYREDGGKYGGEREYLNINEDWAKSKNDHVIDGVTGWEGNDLLRVTTNNGDGTNGPSFWFVVSSQKFLRLRG